MSDVKHVEINAEGAQATAVTSKSVASLIQQDPGCIAVLFSYLLDAMNINQDTVLTESKQINANADVQNQLNSMNEAVKFSLLPAGFSQETAHARSAAMDKMQADNENYAAVRQNIQGASITERQIGSVLSTQASANVDIMQQASNYSGILQTLSVVFQEIDQISPGAGG